MTDEQGTRPGHAGFTQGMLSKYVVETEQAIQECFDELDYESYGKAYLKLATSGTTGALEALGKQQEGKTSKSSDPVDLTRFLVDTWLSSMANAWDATRDLSRLWQKDFCRYVDGDAQSAEASSGQDDNPPPVPADNPPTAPADNPGAAPAPNPGTGTEDRPEKGGRWRGR